MNTADKIKLLENVSIDLSALRDDTELSGYIKPLEDIIGYAITSLTWKSENEQRTGNGNSPSTVIESISTI